MTHLLENERINRRMGFGVGGSEILFGLQDRFKSEIRDVVNFYWSILRSPQALALLTIAGMSLVGGRSSIRAESASMSPPLGQQINSQNMLIVSDDFQSSSGLESLINTSLVDMETSLTDDEALVIRNARIQSAAIQSKTNPDVWNGVPESCVRSMTRLWLYDGDSNDGKVGSASVIDGERVVDQSGAIAWIYRLITADHVVRGVDGNVLDGTVLLFPGDSIDQNFQFQFLDYTQFIDENGILQDSGIVSVVGFREQAKIKDSNFTPLGLNNVRALDALMDSNILYSLDYPGVTGSKPQFTTSAMLGDAIYPNGNLQKIVEPIGNSSTVAQGSSGAAMCDINGNHVSVVSGFEGEWGNKYYAEGNPSSIQEQMNEAIVKSMTKLEEMGFKVISK